MCYVTHRYEVKKYDTEAQALEHIEFEMGLLTSKKIFDETKNGVRVIVYQWYTLYTRYHQDKARARAQWLQGLMPGDLCLLLRKNPQRFA